MNSSLTLFHGTVCIMYATDNKEYKTLHFTGHIKYLHFVFG